MVLLISLLLFLSLFLLLQVLLRQLAPTAGKASVRLKALDSLLEKRSDLDAELERPFSQRILAPLGAAAASRAVYLTPRSIQLLVEEKLAAAGGLGNVRAGGFLALTLLLGLLLPAFTAALTLFAGLPANKVLGYSLYALAAGFALPFFLLSRKAKKRRRSMERDLPDVLDLLTVSVEAGLGFDGALHKLSEKMKGALVEEFARLLNEVRVGVPRRNALMALAKRCNVPDVGVLVTSLVQADQMGVSIGNVLRVQSAAMREKRKQRAQEAAMKAPVKMLLPLILFIFPTIFVVLLGPAVLQIIATFSDK